MSNNAARRPSRRVRSVPRAPRDAAVEAWLLSNETIATGDTPFLAGDTPVVLTEDADLPVVPAGERVQAILALLADPAKAKECLEKRLIETPDFCVAEPSSGRTRGLSAAEDTSDAVYVQRNAKHERHEKRLRHLEKEGLVRERQRVIERIARVERMDLSLLVPAMQGQQSANDGQHSESASVSAPESVPKFATASVPASVPASAPPLSAEDALAHLEGRRKLYLDDARAVLARLDKLLPSADTSKAAGGRAEAHAAAGSTCAFTFEQTTMTDAASVRGGGPGPVPVSLSLVSSLRPAKVFNEYVQDGCTVTSVDYDDKGETCVTASNDETIQIYNCRSGRHVKTLYSKKYGVDLARFTHRSSAIIYASTKEDDTIRYHSLHDNKYLQYYRGHKRRVVSLEMSPVDDTFLSGAVDDSVRLWDLRSPAAQGNLRIKGHPVVAYDPSAVVFAIGLNERSVILLYDIRKFEQNPFLTINIDDTAALSQVSMPPRVPVITSLRFNQTGQYILVGTAGDVHYVVDSFSGKVVFRLIGHVGLERADNAAIGMIPQAGASGSEVCWTPDGNMVIAGSANGQLCVWSLPEPTDSPVTLKPSSVINGHEGTPRVVAFSPRYAQLTTAGAQVAFWLPEQGDAA
ncbi:hypothetical protein MCUN1_003855 [Malassezia cuniculi]|uniref:WD repeat-containing protein 82 n=1 Tax=Malassezia cuniculi TaxID=948313 RepID=A0AAF0ETT2_9BASI|nr:hypothetical protein MCUN1_003855 [Malassezia cuniculi]